MLFVCSVRESLCEYKRLLRDKEEQLSGLHGNLHSLWSTHCGVAPSELEHTEGRQSETMSTDELVDALRDWMNAVHAERRRNDAEEQRVQIVSEQCEVSRTLALKLLAEHAGDASGAIFEFNQKAQAQASDKQSVDHELSVCRDKLKEYEVRQKKFLRAMEEHELSVEQLKQSNLKLAAELNARQVSTHKIAHAK